MGINSHEIFPDDQLELYVNNERVLSFTGKEFFEMSPDRTANTIGVGDIITVNDEEKRVLQMKIHYADDRNPVQKYEIYV